MFQATLSVLWVALCVTLGASSRVGSQDGSCAQGQAAPLRIAPPFAHEDNQLQLQYADQRHLALRELGPRLALLAQDLGKVTYHGEEYTAQRAEIRSPAEHLLGKHRPALEVQIFHRAASGKTLGVAVLFQVGSSRSAFLDAVLKTLHKKGAPGKARPVVLAQGLGKFLSQHSDYFSYASSSCDSDSMALGGPVVDHWVVLSKMKRVTADQLVMLQKMSPAIQHASRAVQNRAPQTVLYSTRAKQEKPAVQTPPIAMVQKAAVASSAASKSRYSSVLAEQATEQYKQWQSKVDAYELQVQEARQRYQARFSAVSGTMSRDQLQQEQQRYLVWEQGVRTNEVQLQQQQAMYIKRLQSFQNVMGKPRVATTEDKPQVVAKHPRRKEAFVNVASSTHTVSASGDQVDMQSRLAALLLREKKVAEAEKHVAEKEKQLNVREAHDSKEETTLSKKESTLSNREQKDVKREQADTFREQKDMQLEQQEKYLQAQIQQSQQILWQEAAGLQAREMQAAQATQAARAAQAAAQQVQAQAEQVLAYTNPQRLLVQKGRAKAETKADAETFRFQLGTSVHTVRNGQVTPPVASQPVAAAAAQPMVAPQVPQQMVPPPTPQIPQVPQAVQQPVAAAPPAPMSVAQAQEQAAQLLPAATPVVVNHGAPKQALLQVKQLKKVQHKAMQQAAPHLPSMEKEIKNMPAAADADNDDDFPPPPDVDLPHVDDDHEDA